MPAPPSSTPQEADSKGRWKEFFRFRRLVFILPVALLAGVLAGYGHYTDPGPLAAPRDVIIPHGNNFRVADALQRQGALAPGWISRNFFCVVLLATAHEGAIHADEFALPARVSIAHLLQILRHGTPVQHYFTVPEGWTAQHIRHALSQVPGLQGVVPPLNEGSVLPQTYAYQFNMSRAQVVQPMRKLMAKTLAEVWAQRDQRALQGVITTPEQLLILASLIEKETSVPEERPVVAQVFLNRLRLGMKLQTDPTVIYALSDGWGVLSPPLVHEDLQTLSPYNTYLVGGLPPGPICSPGLASLKAAAHPVPGDNLYFVANGQGGHRFARSLAEHDANIRAYRQTQPAAPTP
ncbi:endolytic transglycosylase MltG [Oecophyllibacter saccharovorans]|uniref:endolytic transglycosylase MltG n=1 Tax=Oecophyllibacter saccharovorans TaxID=2558360 RepID=UPI0011687758|nr:endolytic transglycosylase MltG [Oecophyllibacter saccharovorans]TPW34731.1 endolytic transglycosylase MltG [Oecophyllibacter saccharovorans]